MPLPMSMASMHVEDNDGSVFIVPPPKKDQSPFIFGIIQTRTAVSNDSSKDLEPP